MRKVIFFLPVTLTAATFYINPSGSDSNACTVGSQCLTLNRAYQVASAGDTIEIANGNYGSQTIQTKAPASVITAQPAAGATVINFGGLTINGGTNFELRSGTTLCQTNCIISVSSFQVNFNTPASNNVTLRNVDIEGWLGYTGGNNISMIGGSVGPLLNAHPQIAPNSGWGTQGNNFIFDSVWFHDMTRDNPGVHTECLQVAGTTGMIIRNSKFTNCAVFDLSFTEYNGSGKVTNLLLENNFFAAAIDGGFFAVNLSQYNGGTSRFNSSVQGWVIQGTNTAAMNFVGNVINNGILSGTSGGCAGGSEAVYLYNVTQGRDCSATDVDAAPGFVSAAATDLHLTAGATAIDFVPTSVAGGCPALDYDGEARPGGSACDAGADEFDATGGGVTTVTTQAATNVASTTATGNGTVVSDGGSTITQRGVCWSTTINPTTSGTCNTTSGTTGAYSVSITGLSLNTLYHYRAYAINGLGTFYGSDVTFTTLDPTDIQIIQRVDCGPSTFSGTCSVTANTAGNLFIIGIESYSGNSTNTVTSITDNASGGSNTYQQVSGARSTNTAGGQSSWNDIWYSSTARSGATTITINFTTSQTANVFIIEASNANTLHDSDQLSSQSTTLTPVSPSMENTATKSIHFALCHPQIGSLPIGISSGNPFTGFLHDGMSYAYLVTSASGTYNAQWDLGTTGTYAASSAAFISASGGIVPPTKLGGSVRATGGVR